MGANESARQAGSIDTMCNPQIEQNCFTVSRLHDITVITYPHRQKDKSPRAL